MKNCKNCKYLSEKFDENSVLSIKYYRCLWNITEEIQMPVVFLLSSRIIKFDCNDGIFYFESDSIVWSNSIYRGRDVVIEECQAHRERL